MAERRDEGIAIILHTAEWFAMAARSPAVSSTGAAIASATVITSMAAKTVVVPAMPVSPVPSVSSVSAKIGISGIRIGIWIRRVVWIRIGIRIRIIGIRIRIIGIRGSSS